MESNSWFGRAADFVMHTFIVYYCAMHLSEWLVFHWFGWIAPVLQISIIVPATDWYLQHFEWATILPALVLGYMDVDQFLPRDSSPLHVWRAIRLDGSLGVSHSHCGAARQNAFLSRCVIRARGKLGDSSKVLLRHPKSDAHICGSTRKRPRTHVGTDVRHCAVLCRDCVQSRCSSLETSAANQIVRI